MGSYGAAKAAVKAALEAGWTTTRKLYQNEVPADPWPPSVAAVPPSIMPTMQPFVFLEMTTMPGQSIRGVGTPGAHLSQTNGMIFVHVFVPDGTGEGLATQYAETIGELFRSKKPYEADGCYLRTWVPRVDEGGDAAAQSEIAGVNAGNWFRVTMAVPFQYFHQG